MRISLRTVDGSLSRCSVHVFLVLHSMLIVLGIVLILEEEVHVGDWLVLCLLLDPTDLSLEGGFALFFFIITESCLSSLFQLSLVMAHFLWFLIEYVRRSGSLQVIVAVLILILWCDSLFTHLITLTIMVPECLGSLSSLQPLLIQSTMHVVVYNDEAYEWYTVLVVAYLLIRLTGTIRIV
jgi:hypothetical protein